METGKFDFQLCGVGSELKKRLLAVPIYQRSYAWDIEEIKECWGDLHSAFSDNSPEYFFGTIVLTRQSTPPRDSIIDGQQRLATTSILLAAFRDEYGERNDATRSNVVQNDYLSSTELASAKEISRLQLNSEDAYFFEQRIVLGLEQPEPSKLSHTFILEAYNYFREEVVKVANDAGTNWVERLTQWVEFLKNRLKVIILEVPIDTDGFLIFETLNDRGADLTIADLLKNYLFGHASDKLDQVRDGWMQVLGALEIGAENALFTTFLRHYWSSKHGAVRERDLYKSFKEHVVSEAQVTEFIHDLQHAATLYAALLSSDHEYWEELGATVKENVETLLRLDLEQNRPLLLAALQHFTNEEKKKLLRTIISWSVRGLIVGGIGGGTAEKNYCRAAVKIRKGEIKTISELLSEISNIVPSDDKFRTAFTVTRVPKAALARYYLLALERGNSGEFEPELVPNTNEEQVNLEHVLPKRAADDDWGMHFDAEERKDYVYRLGNLSLLKKGPNDRIGNKPFVDKKPILKKSALKLTSEIGGESDWTKETINKRQVELAILATKVWPRSID